MTDDLEFFIHVMGDSRPADYCLGCSEGSVYIDFDNYKDKLIRLKRISFDRYGCCELGERAIPMDEIDSRAFKEIFEAQLTDQSGLTTIIKKTLWRNRDLIWEDALSENDLI